MKTSLREGGGTERSEVTEGAIGQPSIFLVKVYSWFSSCFIQDPIPPKPKHQHPQAPSASHSFGTSLPGGGIIVRPRPTVVPFCGLERRTTDGRPYVRCWGSTVGACIARPPFPITAKPRMSSVAGAYRILRMQNISRLRKQTFPAPALWTI